MSTQFPTPSQLLPQIKVDKCAEWTVLKFDPVLQQRHADLLHKREHGMLLSQEGAELEAIQELAAIFSYINGKMAHQRRNRLR
jgi:hypothetical protein